MSKVAVANLCFIRRKRNRWTQNVDCENNIHTKYAAIIVHALTFIIYNENIATITKLTVPYITHYAFRPITYSS